ncbi:MAG TPA: PepSY domain-containing protein [Caulobacteraceae bacterium]|nr:PepSY domain-containing protein [Caulobacteraceae bacterium]
MGTVRWATRLHKWLALVVGVQILFWVLGGLVMTALPIERVRSEHRLAESEARPLPLDRLTPPAVAAASAGLKPAKATLKSTPRGFVWAFEDAAGNTVDVDALTGRRLERMGEAEARAVAANLYAGPGEPVRAVWFEQAPEETKKTGPLWRIDFDDGEKTSFYLSPATGEIAGRRSQVWRFYDFFWRLHILDFKAGENFNHPTLVLLTFVALVVTVTGFVLLWVRLVRDWRNRAKP